MHATFLYLHKFLGIEEVLAEKRSSETCVKCNLCRVRQQIGANCTIDN